MADVRHADSMTALSIMRPPAARASAQGGDCGGSEPEFRQDGGGKVGNRQAGLAGLSQRAGDADEATLTLDEQVTGLLVAQGAGRGGDVTAARDVAHDEVGPALFQRGAAHAQARRGAGGQVLHHAAGLLAEELRQQLGCLRVLHVEREVVLAALGPGEVRGRALDAPVAAAREVAGAGAFDLDDARGQVRQPAGGKRRRNSMFPRDDDEAPERLHRVQPLSVAVASMVSQPSWSCAQSLT